LKKITCLIVACTVLVCAHAQTNQTSDTLPDYDALFNEFTHFIDSLLKPRSFATANIGFGTGHFEYQSSRNTITEKRRFIATPAVGYFHKSGLGLSAAGSVMTDAGAFTLYQTAATASYDYLKNRKLLAGVSFTHFFTKDSLPFYVSPLNNEVNGYFMYRGGWLRPAVAAVYGWGSVTSVEKQVENIVIRDSAVHKSRGKGKGKTKKIGHPPPVRGTATWILETNEAIADLSVTASVKHDFYWLNVISKRDYVRLTPQFAICGGTQRYGIAQTNNTYFSEKNSGTTLLYNTEKSFNTAHSQFQILSLSSRLRAEYSRGIYFIQPQLIVDYFVPERENKLATAFVLNVGILF
jgi:hypothetical protein